jgi:hypothetical protein
MKEHALAGTAAHENGGDEGLIHGLCSVPFAIST